MILSQNIIKHLELEGLTLKRIGQLLDVSPSFISHVKHGRNNLTMNRLMRLEKVLNKPLPIIMLESIDSFTEMPEHIQNSMLPLFEHLGLAQQPPRHLIEVGDIIALELIKYLKRHPRELYSIKPRQFEELVTEILASHGWKVHLTPAIKDGGYDIYAISKDVNLNEESWIIECKKFAPMNKVSVNIVRALYGVKHLTGAKNAMLATTSFFTKEAMRLKTSCYDMDLKDYGNIVDWINEYKPNPNGRLYYHQKKLILP